MVSESMNKIHQTWPKPYSGALYMHASVAAIRLSHAQRCVLFLSVPQNTTCRPITGNAMT